LTHTHNQKGDYYHDTGSSSRSNHKKIPRMQRCNRYEILPEKCPFCGRDVFEFFNSSVIENTMNMPNAQIKKYGLCQNQKEYFPEFHSCSLPTEPPFGQLWLFKKPAYKPTSALFDYLTTCQKQIL